MSNPFLTFGTKDIPTAKLYEKAIIADLEKICGTNAPALTEGKNIYINTEDNLFKTLPNYNIGMLKWLLWHEEQHLILKHHHRFFRYLSESLEDTKEKFGLSKDEVNIIMDILVHDSLCNWFPELIETAKSNYAQLRHCNSLKYTFKTFTLEEMLDEYKKHKAEDEHGSGDKSEDKDEEDTEDKEEDTAGDTAGDTEKVKEDESKTGRKAKEKKSEDKSDEIDESKESSTPGRGEHDDVDWEKAKEIDPKEFIDEDEAYNIQDTIQKIKRKKLKLARVTETLNGLATDQRIRTYAVPSRLQVGKGVILKGRKPGKAKLYLVFDASGSMNSEMQMFKDIIEKSIPQALECPCEWFSGYPRDGYSSMAKLNYPKTYYGRTCKDYYKGKFKDFLSVYANSGYGDDGDRVIELCALAEEKGYNPIGVTDGGGCLRFPDTLKKLKRTVLVGDSKEWLERVKEINPAVQTICTDE